MSDARIEAVPCIENGAPLVDVADLANIDIDDRRCDAIGSWRLLREPVAIRLQAAADLATDRGVRLRLVEGYRPAELQERYFSKYLDELRKADPSLDDAALHDLTSRFVSPPEIAPHTAGAAVDVTLERDGVELDMGTPVNATPEASNGRCYTGHPGVDGVAREHRTLLASVMSAAGFVNYPTEWWHWSYGDRYWAWAASEPAAIFCSA